MLQRRQAVVDTNNNTRFQLCSSVSGFCRLGECPQLERRPLFRVIAVHKKTRQGSARVLAWHIMSEEHGGSDTPLKAVAALFTDSGAPTPMDVDEQQGYQKPQQQDGCALLGEDLKHAVAEVAKVRSCVRACVRACKRVCFLDAAMDRRSLSPGHFGRIAFCASLMQQGPTAAPAAQMRRKVRTPAYRGWRLAAACATSNHKQSNADIEGGNGAGALSLDHLRVLQQQAQQLCGMQS
eukprot:756079-Pelagomonas_calceolata.AAC.3